MNKGIIALDIDGTITVEHHSLPAAVSQYLASLVRNGWQLVFITGRTFGWGYEVLESLQFPYYFAVQNGAIILEMPRRRIVSKRYLERSIIPKMEEVCQGEPTDFVVYSGYEYEDACYYRPNRFSEELVSYLNRRKTQLKEQWYPVNTFDEMPLESFASVKCFGNYDSLMQLANKIENNLGLHVPLIRDPFDPGYYIAQATHPLVNKGRALQDLMSVIGKANRIIAAGDDLNDRSMLAIADTKIVMANAPQAILEMADIVAPPASEQGIIVGLEQALKR